MLVVHPTQKDRFKEAKAHARQVGLAGQLARQLNHLRTYAENGKFDGGRPRVRVTLGWDFAPHSFSILWERRGPDGTWKPWFNGGLIFHGPHDGGGDGGAPTFSVCLTPRHGWSIHT